MNTQNYYSANQYYKQTYGEKVYRLALDGGMSCPNRDGTCGFGGCTFCSESGSGDFTTAKTGKVIPIPEQLKKAKRLVSNKSGRLFIAYFQSFTNTYAPIEYLRKIYTEALTPSDIVALSIATRPDCIDSSVISLLTELRETFKKDIYIELGLQTVNDNIARAFNRGYDYPVFLNALKLCTEANLPVIVHMILGLPNETPDDMYRSIEAVSTLNIHGIKLSLLHIIKNTAMESEFQANPDAFHLMNKEIYIKTLCHCIELIPSNVVIYRITGDAPKQLLIEPSFTADKKGVLNSINSYMRENNVVQGKLTKQSTRR